MAESFLGVRLDAIRRAQNPDGGWGYFPGKQSWLEPTAYATMALHGEAAADRAWKLISSWQSADGSWKPAREVSMPNWAASLCVTIAAVRGEWGAPLRKGVEWLLGSSGAESNLYNRTLARLGLLEMDRDLSLQGWPWRPGNSSWVEPTAHALVALKKVSRKLPGRGLAERVRTGEAELVDIRCADGGWNYGSRKVLGVDLPSYPETTALALLGLQGRENMGTSVDKAKAMFPDASPLARAWLTISLRLHGSSMEPVSGALSDDLMLTAIEALGCAEGNFALLKTEGLA